MEIRSLGRSGLKVPCICLGTATFGNQADETGSFSIMDKAFDAGIHFFDTADLYPLGGTEHQRGTTEIIIGKWIKGRRERIVLTSKCAMPMGENLNQRGLSRKHIMKAAEDSLRRLNTDYIDLYQAHRFDSSTPLEETLRAFDDLVRQGKMRYIGISNWRAWQTAKAIGISQRFQYIPITSAQPRYNLLFRMIEEELIPLCIEEGVGVISFNPLAGGILTGRYQWDKGVEDGTRFSLKGTEDAGKMYQERYWNQAVFQAAEKFREFCAARDYKMSTTAVKWVIQQPGITSAIIGASRPEQLDDTIMAAEANDLSAAEQKELDALWFSLPRKREER